MTKNKGYHISRESLSRIIEEFCTIQSTVCLNPANQQTRYTLEKDGSIFYIDVYFKKNNTITVKSLQKGDNSQFSTDLCGLIRDGVEYKDVVSGTFTTELKANSFKDLTEYLVKLSGVSCTSNEDKGQNGNVVKYITDFGDSITLTYYESTQKLFFQGKMMNLYVIIKTYLAPLVGNDIPTKVSQKGIGGSEEDKVDEHIQNCLPRGFKDLHPIMAGFIKDSFTLVVVGTELSDYAAWVMPTIRVLENCIKKLCLDNNINIDDKKGFKYYTNQKDTDYIFKSNRGKFIVNYNLHKFLDDDTIDVLEKCYKYLQENRHEMFHTTQIVQGTKLVSTPEDAYAIIEGACKLVEESLVFKLSPTA